MLIDTHAHLQDRKFKKDLDQVMERAAQAGVEKIICIGYDYDSSRETVELARKYEQVYAVVGVHPHDSSSVTDDILTRLHQLAKDPKVVAIGEMGLDFYRDLSPREDQRQAFRSQIKLARELYKPVVIHDRDAHQEVLDIVKQEKAGKNGGIMHCYSGHLPLAVEFMKEGFHISFAGPISYKNARKSAEVAGRVAADRLLIETDCPYLTPEPLRGKRNEPAYIKYVAEKLASIRNKTVEEIAYLTSRNAREVYRLTD